MPKNIVLTLTGRDKIGLVDNVTNVIAKRTGNVIASRMARLGGEFAILMLISVPDSEFANLDQDFQQVRGEGYQVTLLPTEDDSKKYAGWLPYEIEVTGADHEGIIHEISHHLATQRINIENMDTSSAPAPMSGTPLFTMKGIVLVPPHLNFHVLSDELEEIGDKLNVNVKVEMVK
ncbi:ACT domain-containing protein [Candidatus Villigracilis saccharophilus]|jgi:glycine cleavage system transcriptional repressor|uniref:glycine cleavage system protein R n=1 Tax=Candidatus Villigracilis saccharophilus TaxID=3140684 RepID=UPI003135EE96|nr:transcriptional regulator [Anaerolineales bacterium]